MSNRSAGSLLLVSTMPETGRQVTGSLLLVFAMPETGRQVTGSLLLVSTMPETGRQVLSYKYLEKNLLRRRLCTIDVYGRTIFKV